MIPYGHQQISDADVAAVNRVLRSDFLTQGPAIGEFEEHIAHYAGAHHAVAVSSATSALHIACLALDVGPGKLVWTTPNTFLASANCALYCGADIDFVDIDPASRNLSVAALKVKLQAAAAQGRLPDVLIPVHFAGEPCDMAAIAALSERYRFRIIEDAAHAVGAHYRDTRTGDCRYSDLTVYSFHPVKIITSAEGGAVTTNDAELHRRLLLLRSHGMERDPARFSRAADGGWYYEMTCLGYNFRMTDVQAALGRSQLERIEEFIAIRKHQADRYARLLRDLPLRLPVAAPSGRSSWHIYVVEALGGRRDRRALFDGLRTAGIGAAVHYFPVHLQPFYRARGFRDGDFPAAEAYYRNALTLPLFPGLTDSQQDMIAATLRGLMTCA